VTQSPDAVRLAQLIKDLWYLWTPTSRGHYPDLVVTLGDGRHAELLKVTYEDVADVLVLHVEEPS